MANRLTTWADTNVLYAAALNGEIDNIFAGTIDRSAGRWGNADDIQVTFGSSQDAIIEFDTAQTNDCLMIGVDSTSRSLIICDVADIATNFAIAVKTNPTLFIHSADKTTIADYISLTHDQTNGLVSTGAGNLVLGSASGAVYINESSNPDMTIGLCINQGANDDAAITLKSSDIAHGITDIVETDTYAEFQKNSATQGGLTIQALSEGTGAFVFNGYHTTDNTDKTTSANAVFAIDGRLRSGTGVANLGANANIIVFRNNSTVRFILDGDGDSHQDVGTAWTNYDSHDDVALLNALSAEVTRPDDPLKAQFSRWIGVSRETLEKARIVTFNDDGHHFINWSRTQMLVIGAIRQIGERLDRIEQKLLEA